MKTFSTFSHCCARRLHVLGTAVLLEGLRFYFSHPRGESGDGKVTNAWEKLICTSRDFFLCVRGKLFQIENLLTENEFCEKCCRWQKLANETLEFYAHFVSIVAPKKRTNLRNVGRTFRAVRREMERNVIAS